MRYGFRWMRLVFAGALACAGLAATAADPAVTNVRAAQREGTAYVDISYDLADADTTNLSVTVEVSTNGGAVYFTPASGLSGDTGSSVARGTGKKIVWNAGAALPPKLYSNVRAQVTASDNPDGDYLVINLSGGAGASSYPVSYLTAVPTGGWTDTYKTTKLVLRKILAGSFTMGSPTDELGRASYEETQHSVTLTKAFYIGVFEVTQRQWELVMGDKPSYFTNAAYYAARPVEQVSYYDIRENPANSDISPDWPDSSQAHADSFMGKLRSKTGLSTFDLPTESQWEYACRAGTTTALNSGKNLTSKFYDVNMAKVGRYSFNGDPEDQGCTPSAGTATAGSYLSNAWGLYDMHGNVCEWCLDWWFGAYPGSVQDPRGAASGSGRVERGGRWVDYAYCCRSAFRSYGNPGGRSYYIGFRAARTLP